MTFPENAQLTVVSAVAGVTAITIVVITAIVSVHDVPHVSADVVQPFVVDVLPAVCIYGVYACILNAADIPAVSVVTITAGVPVVT